MRENPGQIYASLSLSSRELFNTLIFPYFDYCNAIFMHLDKSQKMRLRRLMNLCSICVLNVRRDERITSTYQSLG